MPNKKRRKRLKKELKLLLTKFPAEELCMRISDIICMYKSLQPHLHIKDFTDHLVTLQTLLNAFSLAKKDVGKV